MDQTFSLHDPSSAAIRSVDADATTTSVAQSTAVANGTGAATADEEPDSPGRSPRFNAPPLGQSDPLAEALALLVGVTIALMAVMVPMATVICDPRVVEPAGSSR